MTHILFYTFLLWIAFVKPIDYKEVDKHLSAHWKLNETYFDSLLQKDQNSEYLIGMKYYFCAERIGLEKAKKNLEAEIKKKRISGPFIDLAFAKIGSGLGDKDICLELLETALLKDNNNKWCMYEKYMLLRENTKHAFPILDKLLEIDPLFPRAIIEKAYTIDPATNCHEVISLLSELPHSIMYTDAESYLGDAFYFCDQSERSEIMYKISLTNNENAPAYYGLGNIELYVKNQADRAKEYYLNAVRVDKKFQSAYLGLGWVDYEEGFYLDAESNFLKSYALEKNDAALQDLILFYIKIESFDKAITFINEYQASFGINYISTGYSLAIDLYHSSEDKRADMIEAYNKKFGREGINWSSELFSQLRE